MSTDYHGIGRVVCLSLCVAALTACSSGGGGGDADPSAGTTGGTINTGSSSGGTSSGGGAGSGSSSDKIAPTVTSTSPANGDTGVARNAVVTATFSEDIANGTVNTVGNFTLTANGGNLSGTTTRLGTNTAKFTPSASFPYLTEVTATLTTGISDLAGNPLTANYVWKFITATGTDPEKMVLPTTIGGEPVAKGNADQPQIAVDNVGNAIVIWSQQDTNTSNSVKSIFARRYTAAGGWQAVESLENSGNTATNPHVAFDGNGNIIAIWQQYDGAVNNIVARRFANSAWGSVEPIDGTAQNAINPQIAMNSSGVAMAIWQQTNSTLIDDIAANHFDGANWGGATIIGSSPYPNDVTKRHRQAHVAIDNNGNAIAVWKRDNGADLNDIVTRRYNGTTTWAIPETLDNETGDADNPQIAISNNGKAIAIWEQFNGSSKSIFVNHHDGSNWSTATTIDSSSLQATQPQIAFDNDGNAIAVWVQAQTSNFSTVFANRYLANGNWGNPTALSSRKETYFASGPHVTLGPQGQALAVWYQRDPNFNDSDHVWINRYSVAQGWNSNPTRLDANGTTLANYPDVMLDSNGNAIAAWSQLNSSFISSIWTIRISQ